MSKKTLVLGASLKSNRYSNYAVQRLVANNYEVVAFGIKKGTIVNPGTENPELYNILKENKIPFEAACTLVLLTTNQY